MAILIPITLLALLPWWWPGALRWSLSRYGIECGRTERIGYGRFALRQVRFQSWTADRIEAPVPTAWLWQRLSGKPSVICISGWILQLDPRPATPPPSPRGSAAELLDALHQALPALRRWLPRLQINDGAIVWGDHQLAVPVLCWHNGKLTASAALPPRNLAANLVADLTRPLPYSVAARIEPFNLTLQALLRPTGRLWELSGDVHWQTNRAAFSALLGREGRLPVEAVLTAESFQLPSAALPLPGYDHVKGSLTGRWEHAEFTLQSFATAVPRPGFPAVEGHLQLRGDRQRIQVDECRLILPGVRAMLAEPVRISLTNLRPVEAFQMAVTADLAALTSANLSGVVKGQVQGEWPPDEPYPRLMVRMEGEHVAGAGWRGERVLASGRLRGPWRSPQHEGIIEIERVFLPCVMPLRACAEWVGDGFMLTQTAVELSAGQTTLHAVGHIAAARREAVLRELTVRRQGETLWRLAAPAWFFLDGQALVLESLQCVGPDRELALTAVAKWPRRGSVHFQLRGAALADVEDFVPLPLPTLTVAEMDLDASWDGGPAQISLRLRGQMHSEDTPPVSARAHVLVDDTGVRIESLAVESDSVAVLTAHGTIPVTVEPSAWPQWLRVAHDQPLDVQARTVPDEQVWERLAKAWGVRFTDPQFHLALQGTPAEPVLPLLVTARSVEWTRTPTHWLLPRIEQLRLDAVLRRQELRLNLLALQVEGQPVEAAGTLPLEHGFWQKLLRQHAMPDWSGAEAHLRIRDAAVAPFARYLPTVLAPQGRLQVDLALRPGGLWEGTLDLTDAATRPLLPLGPIRDIAARTRFDGRSATIESFQGRLGGQTVTLTGTVAWPTDGFPPALDLHLSGTNVPLVRQPGLVLRSDLDLRLRQDAQRPATLSGQFRLRDSLFLQDLQALIPAVPAQPARRPPYFRVEESPFADWVLDLRLEGERFLRVRSPLFRGEVSASFDLSGTLGEPILLGEARVSSGVIRFPFANLQVDHGLVSLQRERPHRPEVSLSATGQTFGYHVAMKVHGPVDEPQVTFSAIPALSSEEVLLMVTAGELPRGDPTLTTEQKASRLALYFGRDLLRQLGTPDEALERLDIRAGEEFSQTGVPTYYLEYRLSDRWSVVGEYDRFNALNAGIKWRIFSR